MIIDLIRHTTPDVEKGICYGQTDLDLIAGHQNEFDKIREKSLLQYDLVITSPLKRCVKLSTALPSSTFTQDERIKEFNFGDWEMQPWSELTSNEAKYWMDNFVDHPTPNGESMRNMQQRVLEFWTALLSQNHDAIAVVTHSGVQRLLHAHILQTPIEMMFRLELDFGAIIRINYNRSTKLTTLRHL